MKYLFLTILFFLPSLTNAYVLQTTGFEVGSTVEAQSVTGTYSVSTSNCRTGGFCLRVNPTTSATGRWSFQSISATGQFITNYDTASNGYYRMCIRPQTLPNSIYGEDIFRAKNRFGQTKGNLRINSLGQILMTASNTTQIIATSTQTLSTGSYTCLKWLVPTGSSATSNLWFNGDTSADITVSGDFGTGNNDQFEVGKSTNRNSQTMDIYFDDIAYSNGDDLSYPWYVSALRPNATGTYTDFAGGTNTGQPRWSQVDDTAGYDETDYVEESANNTADRNVTYGFENFSSSTATVYANKIFTGNKKVDSGGGDWNVTQYIGSTLYPLGSIFNVPSLVTGYIQRIATTSADTGSALTPTKLNDSQWGMRIQSSEESIRYQIYNYINQVLYHVPESTPTTVDFGIFLIFD